MADKRMVRGEEIILLAFHALIFIFLQSFAGKRNIIAVGRIDPSRAMHTHVLPVRTYCNIRFSCTLEMEGSRAGSTQSNADNRGPGCSRRGEKCSPVQTIDDLDSRSRSTHMYTCTQQQWGARSERKKSGA